MPTNAFQIRITQVGTTPPDGYYFGGRNDLRVGTSMLFEATWDGASPPDSPTYAWYLLDAPPASAHVPSLTTPISTSSSFSLTADTLRGFRVKLVVNGRGGAFTSTKIAYVARNAGGAYQDRSWRWKSLNEEPGEADFIASPELKRSWLGSEETILQDLLTNGFSGGGGGGGGGDVAWQGGVQALSDLRAIAAVSRTDRQLRLVEDAGRIFRFDSGTGANVPDDGKDTIKPADVLLTDPGRWYSLPSTITQNIIDRVATMGYSATVNTPVPTQMVGISAHRGDVSGVLRDRAALVWDETNGTWRSSYNTSGDDVTIGADLPFRALSLLLSAAILTFGIAGPTITKGTGVPASAEANGSIYLRTNGTDGSTGVYTRQGGAWYALGGGGGGAPTGSAGGDLGGTYPNPTVVAITGASNTAALRMSNLTWEIGVTAPKIGQVARTSNDPAADITITPQAAWASATLTNRKSGGVVVELAGPTNGGTVEASVLFKRDGTPFFTATSTGLAVVPNVTLTGSLVMGSGAATAGAIRLSNNTSIRARTVDAASNASLLLFDTSDDLTVGDATLTSHLLLRAATTIRALGTMTFSDGAGVLGLTIAPNNAGSGITWIAFAEGTAPLIGQTTRTTDAVAHDITFQPQGAYTSATGANRKSGGMTFDFSFPTNGGTTEARFQILRGGGNQLTLGVYDNALPSYSAAWFGTNPPSASTPTFFGDGVNASYLNVSGSGTIFLSFGANAVAAGSIGIDSTTGLTWSSASTAAGIRQTARTVDSATTSMIIAAQGAYGSATGSNRIGGALILRAGPGYSGTSFGGSILQQVGTLEAMSTYVDINTSTSTANVEVATREITANTGVLAFIRVVAIRTDTPTIVMRTLILASTVRNVSGTLTVVDTTTVYDSGVTDASSNIDIPIVNVSGTRLYVLSKQPGAATINWKATIEVVTHA